MQEFQMIEKENLNSERAAVTIAAISLTAAKRQATLMQAFHGTVIELTKNGETVAVKEKSGKWIENRYFK